MVRHKMTMGLGLLSVLAVVVGIIGLWGMGRIGQRAAVLEETHQCEMLFVKVQQAGSLAIGSSDLAENVWKKAKDKFLSAVRKLSQNSALDDTERQVIQSIQKSWKGYETSFNKAVIAGRTGRSLPADTLHAAADPITKGMEELRKGAAVRLEWTIWMMQRLLVAAITLAAIGGLILGRIISRAWFSAVRTALDELRNAPVSDDLVQKGESIRKDVENLANLIGRRPGSETTPDGAEPPTSEQDRHLRS